MSPLPADEAERRKVRTELTRTLFVEAGAGTGKTTELVTRVTHAVATGHLATMAQLAAITFTENAASELRTRIREGLEARARLHGAPADEHDRVERALREIDDAAITTLHGFAARILQDVPLEAGLPPGFVVNDAIRAQVESSRRWQTFLDDLLDDEQLARHLLVALTLELKLDKLREVADAFDGSWDALQDRPFTVTPLTDIRIDDVLTPLRRAAAVAADAPEGDKLTAHLRRVVAPAVDELAALEDDLDRLEALQRLEIKTGLGTAKAFADAGLSKPDVVADLKEANEARVALLAAVGAAAAETLCTRLQDRTLEDAERRRHDGSLTFHDLLVLARDVLRQPEVRRLVHQRYPVLLIDEFQDTDPLQVEIACLIAGRPDEEADRWDRIGVPDGRLFFVGDAKQSIYRFRRADVELYAAVRDRFHQGRTSLSVNFRSVPGVVDTVNHVFGDLIGNGTSGQVPYAALTAHRRDGRGPAVRLLGQPADGGADEQREAEAAHLADVAVRAKSEGWVLAGRRTASYRDVAILLPTRTSLPAIEAALQARDVPYRIESRSLVWATDAVRDVVTLLQALATPADEVAVVASLRLPGLACSDRDLVGWAAAGGRWSYLAPAPAGAEDSPVAAAMATLREHHDLRWWLPVHELVERIVRELRLLELTAELHRPRDHWRRLRFVIDQARAFCDGGGHGLGEFVQWAVDQIESEADVLETVVPESDDDAVRILTVHGSKGLEFPVTVVAGLGIGPRTETTVLWGGSRPEVRFKSPWLGTAGFAAQQEREKELAQAESVRLLYVATTRAQDHLVLGCHHKATKSGYGSHAQQLWRLLHGNPLVVEEPAPTGLELASPQAAAVQWTLPQQSVAGVRADHQSLLESVRSRVATTPTALVAAAAAVDEPELDGDDVDELPAERSAAPYRRLPSRTGAAIGTAVHGVLEMADLLNPTTEEFRRLAEVLAAEEEIPSLARDVAARARAAADAPLVKAAAQGGSYWREVYVVVHESGRVLEGYIDLLVRDENGQLVVVDYKTDRLSGPKDAVAKAEHYRPQLNAYARALAAVLQEPVSAGALVFAHVPTAPQVDMAVGD